MWVVLSAAALVFGLPGQLSTSVALTDGIAQLIGVVLFYTVVSGAFDLFGGYFLPREYGRFTLPLGRFLGHWFRGALLHGIALTLIGLALLTAARLGGFGLVLAVYLATNLLLVYGQLVLARALGGLRPRADGDGVMVLESPYSHFTGGVVGLGKGRLVVPELWRDAFSPQTLTVLVERKGALVANGSRLAGLALAFAWNLAGFVLAYLGAETLGHVAGLVSFSLWSTLWAFVGVLLLPTPSRWGVFAGDALVTGEHEQALLADAVRELDHNQDDEYSRAAGVETIFHPLPAAARRIDKLGKPAATWGPWHTARVALYLSWANLSWLSRAVHCNIGRPEVWVLLPSD